MLNVETLKKYFIYFIIIFIAFILIDGCARWPEDPNGGGGTGQKLLTVRVDINNSGVIDTDNGYYYIVFDSNEDASFPPDDDIANWEDGYYYIRLDEYGLFFGEVGNNSEENIGSIPSTETYFQVAINIAKLGNPNKIFMNVLTTDKDEETYDYMEDALSLTINDTDFVPYNNIVSDFQQDSSGGTNFDIVQVNTSILVP